MEESAADFTRLNADKKFGFIPYLRCLRLSAAKFCLV